MNTTNIKVIKICTNEWNHASRDVRELTVCRELGASVFVIAKGIPGDRGRKEIVSGFEVYRMNTRPIPFLPKTINRFLSVFLWAHFARKQHADVITGHDLGGLTIGWLSRIGKKKPLLVYDAHEFELGRNKKRSKAMLVLVKFWEKRMINKSVFSIVVNESIAQEMKRIHGLKELPLVIRNIPQKWDIDWNVVHAKRLSLLKIFGNNSFIMMYHGALLHNRGIELAIEATKAIDGVKLVLLGNPETEAYLDTLKTQIERLGIEDRVLIKGAVPHDELWKYVGAIDLSLAPIVPVYKSYYYSLPNKLFESIQCHVPIVASDLPEMKRIVEGFRIGETFKSDSIEDLIRAIKTIMNNLKEYYLDNLIVAEGELSWEKEKKKLENKYLGLFNSIT